MEMTRSPVKLQNVVNISIDEPKLGRCRHYIRAFSSD